ncbi:sensor histidine kinase [Brevundimonas sp.]|uniref:sensor histidine kinase n=1 Tax=Brevundimonas sp. TaxID=1871086 RepID=UPI002D4F0EA0|nr:histidine kinase [Brevundimonas sp.]HYC98148.1 histidine kinase [Brevundimonas sp.]
MRTPKAFHEPEIRQALIIAAGVWAASVPVFMAPTLAAPEPAPAWVWMATGLVSLMGVLLTPVLLWVVRAADRWAGRALRLVVIVGAVALVALIHSVIDTAVHDLLLSWFHPNARGTMFVNDEGQVTPAPLHYYVLMNFITLLWVHAGVTALGVLSRFNMRARRQEVATAEARAAANHAKLATLRLQLSPHFMFNTLNAISSLILTGRNADAERMLTRLSDFLRASLGPGEAERVSLASELSAVSAYLDIESMRYDGQLDTEVVSDESLHEAMVPTFLLQPLAEQAVAHAVSPPRRAVTIRLWASRDAGDTLAVAIQARAADGSPSSMPPPPLDLAAVRSRLAAVYDGRAEIEGTSDVSGFTATARLPLDRAGAGAR